MKNYVATLAIALTLALAQSAQAQGVTPPPVPDKIAVPAPDKAFLLGRGLSTQSNECQFFAGGFLGAHIEGDRCDCDDPVCVVS